jgi:endonuclease I
MFQSSFSRAVLFLLLSSFSIQEVTGQRKCPELTCTSKNFNITIDLDEYYSATEGKTGEELKEELNTIIRVDHYKLTWNPCTWVAIAEADADPDIPGRVRDLYTNNSFALLDRDCGTINQGPDVWNREHMWAQAHGFKDETTWHAYTDLHHLFASDKSINNDNRKTYDFKSSVNTFENNNEDNNIICDDCKTDEVEGTFEPPDYVKGRIARAMLYMDTRYDGKDDGNSSLNLTLVNTKTFNKSDPEFGYLEELLKWHEKFQPTDRERKRNDVVQKWQGNRNPFIDRPDFVKEIWSKEYPLEGDPEDPEVGDPEDPEVSDPEDPEVSNAVSPETPGFIILL